MLILLKRPDNKQLDDDHRFLINPKYENPMRRVVVQLIKGVADMPAEAIVSPDRDPILLARRNMIDCAIVRLMKTRQQMKHQELTAEVMNALKARFDPKPTDVRKRIDALIEQADPYLRRDENNRALYHYIA